MDPAYATSLRSVLVITTMRFTTLLTLATAAVASLIDLTDKTFEKTVLNAEHPTLVKFYAPWCGHCKKMGPDYDQLAAAYAHTDAVEIARYNGDEQRKFSKKYGIQGFPTLKWFPGQGADPVDYESGRDFDSLVQFVAAKSGVKAKTAPKSEGAKLIQTVDDQTFADLLKTKKYALVAFTAKWCGYCKQLAPEYEKVAAVFARDPVSIAQVDCTEPEPSHDLLEKYEVNSYPTLLWFEEGAEPVKFEGGDRSLEGLVAFINDKTGLNRNSDGSYNDQAGVFSGKLLEQLREAVENPKKVKQFIGEIPAAFSAVYERVLAKVGALGDETEAYLDKEIARLGNIIEKKGAKQDKLDEFKIRQNVLKSIKALKNKAEHLRDEL
ncbi:Protein disulfide-isomerase erp38 [Yarrowia sp. B02]|nr:Protein disulfide-isomerase erp38 [Yarrowia sp. B02]